MIDLVEMDPDATTVLIADANPDTRAALMWVLLSEGFWVEPVANGLDAAAALEADPPDVAIIDLSLPGFSGRSLIERMRASDRLGHVPIIAISSEPPWTPLPAGVPFLQKPCAPNQVLAVIHDTVGDNIRRFFSGGRPFKQTIERDRGSVAGHYRGR
jgi:DNA-binding response OmpR family regulator